MFLKITYQSQKLTYNLGSPSEEFLSNGNASNFLLFLHFTILRLGGEVD